MRIIAGKYAHRKIVFPHIDSTKPTRDMVKEAIFSSLGNINDNIILDLFAGSGSYGIEALSRGASFCYFNDFNKIAIDVIRQNLTSLNETNFHLTKLDYLKAIQYYKDNNLTFDLVFLDPPYALNVQKEVFEILKKENLLRANARVVVESNKIIDFKNENYKMKKYSNVLVYIISLK